MRIFPTFLLCTACFLAVAAKAQPGLLDEFRQKWNNAAGYTIAYAEAMPAERYDFQPTAEEMTFSAQLLHIASNMVWLSSRYLEAGDFPKDLKQTNYSKEDILAILREAYDFAGRAIASLDPGRMEDTVEFFAGPLNKRQILILMNDHSTHHRGQLAVYLRLCGVTPPRYIGW